METFTSLWRAIPPTGIRRRLEAGGSRFGKVTVRTPAVYCALAFVVSADSGRRTDRVILPKERSTKWYLRKNEWRQKKTEVVGRACFRVLSEVGVGGDHT